MWSTTTPTTTTAATTKAIQSNWRNQHHYYYDDYYEWEYHITTIVEYNNAVTITNKCFHRTYSKFGVCLMLLNVGEGDVYVHLSIKESSIDPTSKSTIFSTFVRATK
jgi:hypothetical protein